MTGLRVDYYALVDFRGFVEMVDALGGVTVTVTRPVLDRVSPPTRAATGSASTCPPAGGT